MADLTMTRGDNARLTFTARDAAGVLLPLTSQSVWFTAARIDGSLIVQKKTGGTGITFADPQTGATLGVGYVDLLPTDTSALPNWTVTLAYEVQMLDGGEINTLERGTLTVTPDLIVGQP